MTRSLTSITNSCRWDCLGFGLVGLCFKSSLGICWKQILVNMCIVRFLGFYHFTVDFCNGMRLGVEIRGIRGKVSRCARFLDFQNRC